VKDWPFHLLLFFIAGTIIVVIGAMFAEQDDRAMLKSLRKRWVHFFLGCLAVVVVMLICEHTLASVN